MCKDILLDNLPGEPLADANQREMMANNLTTHVCRKIVRLRRSTVEPVFGNIKEIQGFRQYSLRGRKNVTGEWRSVSRIQS